MEEFKGWKPASGKDSELKSLTPEPNLSTLFSPSLAWLGPPAGPDVTVTRWCHHLPDIISVPSLCSPVVFRSVHKVHFCLWTLLPPYISENFSSGAFHSLPSFRSWKCLSDTHLQLPCMDIALCQCVLGRPIPDKTGRSGIQMVTSRLLRARQSVSF